MNAIAYAISFTIVAKNCIKTKVETIELFRRDHAICQLCLSIFYLFSIKF